jgi:predicted DCC family thiol-disulfide oxidoreductase YuxK
MNCMKLLGGVGLLAGADLTLAPKFVRDRGYDTVGRWRYRLAGRLDPATCPILPAPLGKKFLGKPSDTGGLSYKIITLIQIQ